MARWRLTQKHYLNIPGQAEYEYKETTNTGRQVRKTFPVPTYLDPDDPRDCNYPGEVVVAHEGKGASSKDYIFVGDPTLDMHPLDDEAEAISEGMKSIWGQAYVDSGDEGYTGKLLLELTQTLNSFNSTARPSSPVADDLTVKVASMEIQMKQLMEMNMALVAKLNPERRV